MRAKCGLKQRLITNAIGSSDPPLVIAKLFELTKNGVNKSGSQLGGEKYRHSHFYYNTIGL
jgi:hypothetical protein